MYAYMIYDHDPKNDYWAGKTLCPVCGKPSHFHLQKTTRTLCLFVIPLITMTDDRYITCDCCGYTRKLRIKEYNKIMDKQKQLLVERNYPREMIEADFVPKNVPIAWRMVKLILAGVLTTAFLIGALSATFTAMGLLGSLVFALFMSLMFSAPFFLSLKGLVPCWRKRSFYKKREQFPALADVAVAEEINCISECVGSASVEQYENMFRRMDELTENASEVSSKTKLSAGDGNVEKQSLKPLKAVPAEYPTGKGWFRYASVLFVVPKSFMKEKELHAPCYRLAAGRFRMLLIMNSILLVLGLTVASMGIWGLANNTESSEGLMFLGLLGIGGAVGILFANRVQTSRIIKSMRMLLKTGKFQYIDEIMPFIGNTNEKFIFEEHLMYDKGARLVAAYDNILWVYTTTDENNNIRTTFCMSDGLRYVSTMDEILLKIFLKRKQDVLFGKSRENEELYKQKLALLNICGH